MGIQDRDYMRERTRPEQTKLEYWVEAPFRDQRAALLIGALGGALAQDVPATLLTSIFPDPIQTDPGNFTAGMFIQMLPNAILHMAPIFRLIGVALLIPAGVSLIINRNQSRYCTAIKNPTLSAFIGGASIITACLALFGHILSEDRTTQIAEKNSQIVASSNQTIQQSEAAIHEPVYIDLPIQELAPDRPFPTNGTFERKLPLQGKIARMDFANRSQNNVIVVWYYNLQQGQGDQEALRLYLTAGQSGSVEIPAFDYRIALYEANPSLGLDRGFGPDAKMKDLGLVDLKTEALALSKQPIGTYHGYGIYNQRVGTYAAGR